MHLLEDSLAEAKESHGARHGRTARVAGGPPLCLGVPFGVSCGIMARSQWLSGTMHCRHSSADGFQPPELYRNAAPAVAYRSCPAMQDVFELPLSTIDPKDFIADLVAKQLPSSRAAFASQPSGRFYSSQSGVNGAPYSAADRPTARQRPYNYVGLYSLT